MLRHAVLEMAHQFQKKVKYLLEKVLLVFKYFRKLNHITFLAFVIRGLSLTAMR